MPEDWCAIAGTHMMEGNKQFLNCSLTNAYTCTEERINGWMQQNIKVLTIIVNLKLSPLSEKIT